MEEEIQLPSCRSCLLGDLVCAHQATATVMPPGGITWGGMGRSDIRKPTGDGIQRPASGALEASKPAKKGKYLSQEAMDIRENSPRLGVDKGFAASPQ